jgi:hypothetical protein
MTYEEFKEYSPELFSRICHCGMNVDARLVLQITHVLNMLAKANGFDHRVRFVNSGTQTMVFMIDETCRYEPFELEL